MVTPTATVTLTQTEQDALHAHKVASFLLTDMLAGKAIFTLVSKKSGTRFTYKVAEHTFDDGRTVHFVSVLRGQDNEGDYAYMGMIRDGKYAATKNSKVSSNAPSFAGFAWLWQSLQAGKDVEQQAEIWHAGHCFKCGRQLTVPASIETGYGPVCAGKLAE